MKLPDHIEKKTLSLLKRSCGDTCASSFVEEIVPQISEFIRAKHHSSLPKAKSDPQEQMGAAVQELMTKLTGKVRHSILKMRPTPLFPYILDEKANN